MHKLFALLVALLAVIGAVVVATLFYWRRGRKSSGSSWSSVKDTTSAWAKSASDQAGEAAGNLSGMAGDATKKASDNAEEVKASLGELGPT
jgi:hypothetical protein